MLDTNLFSYRAADRKSSEQTWELFKQVKANARFEDEWTDEDDKILKQKLGHKVNNMRKKLLAKGILKKTSEGIVCQSRTPEPILVARNRSLINETHLATCLQELRELLMQFPPEGLKEALREVIDFLP